MSQQLPPDSGSAHQLPINPLPSSFPSPYDDPANILRVYPFATYTPTARVASHLASHTVTYPASSSSAALYPQFESSFYRIDHPSTSLEYSQRHQAEIVLSDILQKSTYSNQVYEPSLKDAASTTSSTSQISPLSYSFLRDHKAPTSRLEPSTSSEAASSLVPSVTNDDSFENYITRSLQMSSPSSIVSPSQCTSITLQPSNAVPTLTGTSALQLAFNEASDPLDPSHSSPAKKYKSSSSSRGSRGPTTTSNMKGMQSSSQVAVETPNRVPSANSTVKTVNDPERSVISINSIPPSPAESDEDEMDWDEGLGKGSDSYLEKNRKTSDSSPVAYGAIPIVQTSGHTGERDMRSSSQKLQTLCEDIFDESDSFPADPSAEDVLVSKFFDRLASDNTHPLMSALTIDKLIRYASRLRTSKQKHHLEGVVEHITWDVDNIARLLKMLEMIMHEAENLEPFRNTSKTPLEISSENKTKSTKNIETDGSKLFEKSMPERGMTLEHLRQSEETLHTMMLASSASLCCLVVLDCDDLPKHLYSEDLLSLAISIVRAQMTKVLFPVIEGMASEKLYSTFLSHIILAETESLTKRNSVKHFSTSFNNVTLSSIAQSTCASVPHIASLVSRPGIYFSDSLIIKTVYMAIGPLFINEPNAKRAKGKESRGGPSGPVMKSLRMEALHCLRVTFAKYDEQRQWIIEEILSSLGQRHEQGTSLTRFQSINTFSALMLQLIQASAHGIGARIRKLRLNLGDADAGSDADMLFSTPTEEAQIVTDSIEMALRSTRVVTVYLVQKFVLVLIFAYARSGSIKGILDTFVHDLLEVLYRPEWPAASLFLSVLSKTLISALDDPKPSNEIATRNIALDYLGDIAARLRRFQLEMSSQTIIPSLDEVIASADLDGCKAYISAHNSIQNFLEMAAREDGMFTSSGDMSRVIWAQELNLSLRKIVSVTGKLDLETDEVAMQTNENLQAIAQIIWKTLKDVWVSDSRLFELSDPRQADVALRASVAVSRSRSLQSAFDPILRTLVTVMDSPTVTLRLKSLRGMGSVVTVDPDVLSLPVVHAAIEERLSDTSSAVRDAAVELIGKYVIQRSSLVDQYYPHIARRITDSGLGVRKRVVKLLRDIFAVTNSREVRIGICCNLVVVTEDEDDAVKELALKSLSDILYPSASNVPEESASLLVDILEEYDGPSESIETALQGVSNDCRVKGQGQCFAQTIEALMKRLVDATEQVDFDTSSHVRAIFLLSFNEPALIDTNKAAVLLTYLCIPTNSEQRMSNDLILRIFTRSIPFMPKASSTFAQDLTKALLPMIGRPTGGIQSLKEPIACFCSLVDNLTHDFLRLISVLRSCEAKIRTIQKETSAVGLATTYSPASAMVFYITALIVEHCNLDRVAERDVVIRLEIAKITKQTIAEHFFDIYINFARESVSQPTPTMCLNSLFCGYPQLILHEKAMQWMTEVFSSSDLDSQARLLSLIHDFLLSEAKRKRSKAANENKDVSDLIGCAGDLQESGVSTAVVQRNIEYILEGAKSQHQPLQVASMDVLAFTVKQGLYHPLLCLPILISLETSVDGPTANRALSLHASLHGKHASLLNVRHLEFARQSYNYQRTLTSEVKGCRHGVSLLAGWYSILSEKRIWRLDFLRALTRAFDVELSGREVIEPQFVLYIAENLALFDYKFQEEVMVVVQQLSLVVSGGVDIANAMEEARVCGTGLERIVGKAAIISESEEFEANRLCNGSIIISLALLTKNLLLDVYGISEDKCLKLVNGKKSTIGDKLVNRRMPHPVPLDHSRIPFVSGAETVDNFETMQAAFRLLMRDYGSLGQSL